MSLLCKRANNLQGTSKNLSFHKTNSENNSEKIKFFITTTLNYYLTGTIPATASSDPDGLSITMHLYLSEDEKLDPYDIELDVTLTAIQRTRLRRGILNDQPVDLSGENLVLDTVSHPEYLVFCGYTYLLAEVRDNKNDPGIDPDLTNNAGGSLLFVNCIFSGDTLALTNFQLEPLPPQNIWYNDVDLKVHFTATIDNFGPHIAASPDDKPNIFMTAYVSLSREYDPSFRTYSKIQLDVQHPKLFEEMVADVGHTEIDGTATLNLPLSTCTSTYLLLVLHRGVHIDVQDDIPDNNVKFQDISALLKCSSDSVDFSIVDFNIQPSVSPGEMIPFTLVTSVETTPGREVGSTADPVFTFQFYLSTDDTLDAADLSLEYSGQSQASDLSRVFTGTTQMILSHGEEFLHIPADLPVELCGRSYIIATLDEHHLTEESSEYDNTKPVLVQVSCALGK